MDFIICLSLVGRHYTILVVINRFFKYSTFIPMQPLTSLEFVKQWGLAYLPTTYHFIKSRNNFIEEAQEALARATQ
ncbi:unnamed protein product [Spirodela intermedia]|uniref:Uncharacterized protein n=2 Tax=Spirodela intermedia TaxID=51605 RepID=A0A7I8LEN9_SPIIN|nr:unnamed protein product [Spirodela intermedia]CAA6671202.1 unnamed protein product [Spirodela intermedia]CAA7408310.1 unnamed protein product [Spirodela intermedia]